MSNNKDNQQWLSELEKTADRAAETICPHYFDSIQRGQIKDALIDFAKIIIEGVKEDYRKNYWNHE